MNASSPRAPRVLVLGGTGAIGAATCSLLRARGASVVFTYFEREAQARALSEALGATALALDLCSVEGIGVAVERASVVLGGFDAVVVCAAPRATVEELERPFSDLREADYDAMADAHAKGAFFVAQHASRHFTRGGNLVFVGSVDQRKGVPVPVHYGAAKGALVGLARALAKALGPRDIRVNVVAPGLLTHGAGDALPGDLRAEYLLHCGQKRFGNPAELAAVLCYFALENTYVSGEVVPVDGGL